MKKVAVYMRVSTAGQEQEQTIQNQEIELRDRIKSDGHLLSPDLTYKDDGWSGAIIVRPDLDRLRQDAKDGKIDILYIYDRGRLARLLVPQEIIMEELRKNGVEIISLHDINDDSVEGLMLGKVMGAFHEYERLKITERMRLGKIRKVRENGNLLGYNPKYGYDYHPRIKGKNGRNGYLTINSKQAEVVQLIFTLYGEQGMSKYGIRAELFRRGIMPAKGKSKQWSTGVIDRLLRDTTYIGRHFYNKTESCETKNPRKYEKYRRTLKGSRVERPKDDWMEVEVDPIIKPSLFDKVQVQLERNKRLNSRNNKKNQYLLSGLINCPCGFARTGDPANGCTYYRCTDRLNHATGLRQCFERGINSTVLDALVWSNVKEKLQNPALIAEYAQKWQENASPIESQLDMLKKQVTSLNEQIERLLTLYTTADITEKTYRARKDEIATRRDNVIHEINDLEALRASQPKLPLEKLVCGVLELLQDPSFLAKREIIRTVVTKVVATQTEINVWGLIPLVPHGKVNLNVTDSYAKVPNQSVLADNLEGVGLNVSHRYSKVINQSKPTSAAQIPFELNLSMPKPDRGGRGYSDELVLELQTELNQ